MKILDYNGNIIADVNALPGVHFSNCVSDAITIQIGADRELHLYPHETQILRRLLNDMVTARG